MNIYNTLDDAIAAGWSVYANDFRQVDDGNGGIAVMAFETLDAAELWDNQQ
jgi:hypothetical protein